MRPLPGGRATACLHYERTIESLEAERAGQLDPVDLQVAHAEQPDQAAQAPGSAP
jgi:hypothetical protein